MKKPLIGFIGQGWIGKNYADDFEHRGYSVIRYGLEDSYSKNKETIPYCDIVFIAVPTPTTQEGFDDGILRSVIPLVGKGKIAVIKSTLVIGRTKILQDANLDCFVIHSPEFLSERTAVHDAAHPDRNIIGIPKNTPEYQEIAQTVMGILPKSPFNTICSSDEAEFIKYSHNIHGYIQVVFSNLLYDVSKSFDMDWSSIKKSLEKDPMMSHRYLDPFDAKGRGAGGHCFIKDFEAFIELFNSKIHDEKSILMLEAIRNKNLELLISSGKDTDLVERVYGKGSILKK